LEAAKHTKDDDDMAHHEGEATAIGRVLEVLAGHGLEGMAAATQTLMNEAMMVERAAFLGAAHAAGRGRVTDAAGVPAPRP
jgi:hypothetical protein